MDKRQELLLQKLNKVETMLNDMKKCLDNATESTFIFFHTLILFLHSVPAGNMFKNK